MADIAPQLLQEVQASFSENFRKNKKISSIYANIRKGNATFKDAENFASETGKALSAAYDACLSSDVLPDGKMYYNIAERVLGPTLAQNFALATKVAGMVQENLNEQANIGMKAALPALSQDKVDGFLNRISSEDSFDNVKWILGAPVETFTQSAVDDTIQENAELQYKSGMRPKIVRTCIGKCCDWCEEVAGTYYYPDVPKDVFRRHNNCNCMVEYFPGDGRVQNAHSKVLYKESDRQKFLEYAKGKEAGARALEEERRRGRILNYGSERTFERDFDSINARKLEHYTLNNLYIEDGVSLRPRDVRALDGQISQAKNILGIENACKVPIVIVNDNSVLAAYNPRTNTLYVSSKLSNLSEIEKIQSNYACPDDPRSTMIHEMFHWMDAEEYRQLGKTIESAEPASLYSIYQKNRAKEALIEAGVDLSDPQKVRKEISRYASEALIDNDYEEVYTEYRTINALKGSSL